MNSQQFSSLKFPRGLDGFFPVLCRDTCPVWSVLNATDQELSKRCLHWKPVDAQILYFRFDNRVFMIET